MYVSDYEVYKGKTCAHKEHLPDVIHVLFYFYFHDRYRGKQNRHNANRGYTIDCYITHYLKCLI